MFHKKKTFDTRDSRVVPHRSTDRAQWCLTSQFGRDTVYPPWYDRMMGPRFLWCMPGRKRKKFCSKKKNWFNKKKNCSKKKFWSQKKKICANEKKHSTPEIPVWSPTTVLVGPNGAWLRSSDGMRYIHHGVIEWWDVWFSVVPRLSTDQRTVKFMFQLFHLGQVRVGVVGNISACHADAPGSIPGHGVSNFFFPSARVFA